MRRSRRFHDKPERHRRSQHHDQPRRKDSGADQSSTPQTPANYGRELRDLLSGIGTPPPAPFKPDPFQLQALAALEFEDVLVTAPTGSGKTWIAREEIRRLLDQGKRSEEHTSELQSRVDL